jgi:hypothetical protein
VASRAIRIAHEKGKCNLSDVLTKFLAAPDLRRGEMHIDAVISVTRDVASLITRLEGTVMFSLIMVYGFSIIR